MRKWLVGLPILAIAYIFGGVMVGGVLMVMGSRRIASTLTDAA